MQLFAADNHRELVGAVLLGSAFAGILYSYAGYPLFLWFLSRLRPLRQSSPSEDFPLSFIIAAHNEAAGIRRKLEQTLALEYPREKLQIIVASDGSSDNTDDIVREFAGQGVELVQIGGRLGKTNAQNIAVRHARGEVLVFSDATTLYDPQALRYLAGAFCDRDVGAASGRYDYYDPTASSPAASGSATFWSIENWIKRMQARISTLSGCCGCIYAVRRELYTELAPELISDLVQPLHILLQGRRVVFQEKARAWEEATPTANDEFNMRVRVATRGMKGLLSTSDLLMPWKHPWIAFQLWSHKIARWCIPIFLLSLLAGAALLASRERFQVLLLLQISFYGFAFASMLLPILRRSRILSLPLYFCTINTAFLMGMFHVISRRQFTIWQPLRR